MDTLATNSTLPSMATVRLNSRNFPLNWPRFLDSERRGRRRAPPLRLRASAAAEARRNPSSLSKTVEVVGIGSRKDSVINFCINYRSDSSSRMRFWTIQKEDSNGLQLLQRFPRTDDVRNVEFPLSEYPCPQAVVLVASSGHGLEHITGIELLNSVKAAGGLAFAVILEPFGFEGRRRQEEVKNLINKLEDCSHFQILVKSDSLVKREVGTFAEALEIVNNAVYLALSTITVVSSETCMKFQNSSSGEIRDLRPTEIIEILETYGQANVDYGAGYDLQSAVNQAVSHAPFLDGCIEFGRA